MDTPEGANQKQQGSSMDVWGHLCARLCHELISPIGAIQNAAELLEEAGELDPEIMGLLNQSATKSSIRLQFYRIAYGYPKPRDYSPDQRYETLNLIRHFLLQNKIDADLDALNHFDPIWAPQRIRLLFNAIVVVASYPLKGGKIAALISYEPNLIDLVATGHPLLQRPYEAEPIEISPQTIQPHFLTQLSKTQGCAFRQTHLSEKETRFQLRLA